MNLEEILLENGWEIVETLKTDEFQQKLFPINDLALSKESMSYLKRSFSNGIYLHQQKAIQEYLDGKNVCLATRTASGKSASFYVAAIEELTRNPIANIIAIYPTKALGNEQEDRWRLALDSAGLHVKVGRIDGSVKPLNRRISILKDSRVLVCTPDIIHAWFLSHLNDHNVLDFFKSLTLVIVDEVHTYTGVFGSNSAFLYRRIQHLKSYLGNNLRFVGASATISNPEKHLADLFGVPFSVVGEKYDTSPRYSLDIHLVNMPGESDFLTEVVSLLRNLSLHTQSRFITFVDSRKQVELMSSILARSRDKEDSSETIETQDDVDEYEAQEHEKGFDANILDDLDVLPYRAGYEEYDRAIIQERLSTESLKGVISTSGLELGIDIPHLNTCVLVGVPRSATSLFQRIGRVGRQSKGNVIVINTGDIYNEAIFDDPGSFLRRPLAESTLYLENEYIQYIHALCLARLNGEHDQVISNDKEEEFISPINWPGKFVELCKLERAGQIPRILQSMKAESGDTPNYSFPLRDVESQFQVEYKRGHQTDQLGSLGYDQLMREAYPGAIYYYATQPYRVYKVNRRSKQVYVRKVKRYTTQPQKLPTLVFPNLTRDNIYKSCKCNDLILVECDMQIRESLNGFKERRGPNENIYPYPLSGELGFYFDQNLFTRNYFTTGVIVTHPVMNQNQVNVRLIAELFYEAFLIMVPFERQDINFAADKHRLQRDPLIAKDDRFFAIYDQTYGSLRLTNRAVERNIIPKVFEYAKELAKSQKLWEANSETIEALDRLIKDSYYQSTELIFDIDTSMSAFEDNEKLEMVIIPGSKGLNSNRDNEEFFINRVFYHPQGLRYEGITQTLADKSDTTSLPFVRDIIPIPGISEMGIYNFDTGEIVAIDDELGVKLKSDHTQIDLAKLRFVLGAHFSEIELKQLCNEIGMDYHKIPEINKEDEIEQVLAFSEEKGLTQNLLQAAFRMSQFKQSGEAK